MNFNESHVLTDVKLVIGFSAAFVAAVVALISNKIPFELCKFELLVGVVLYFILYSIYLYYTTFIEKSTVYRGINKVLVNIYFRIPN